MSTAAVAACPNAAQDATNNQPTSAAPQQQLNGHSNQPQSAMPQLPSSAVQKKASIISSNNNDYTSSLTTAVLTSVTGAVLAAASPSSVDQCTPTKQFSLPSQLGSVGSSASAEECKPLNTSASGHMGAGVGGEPCSTPSPAATGAPAKQFNMPPPGGVNNTNNVNNINGGAVKGEVIMSDEGSTYSNDIIYQC